MNAFYLILGAESALADRALTKLNAQMKLDMKLKSLKEVDMVWLGSDFSDMDAK